MFNIEDGGFDDNSNSSDRTEKPKEPDITPDTDTPEPDLIPDKEYEIPEIPDPFPGRIDRSEQIPDKAYEPPEIPDPPPEPIEPPK